MKVIIAHPAQQHSYRLATAIKKSGHLYKYITTVYNKKWSLTRLITFFLKGDLKNKASQRSCSSLEEKDVIQFCEISGLFKLACMYIKPLKKFYSKIKYYTADSFAKKVANYALNNKVDMVITYDDCSPILFEILKEKNPNIIRVLDVSAANRLYMKTIYDEDLKLSGDFGKRLKNECAIVWDEKFIERNIRELQSSQYFLVASSFVQKSLNYSGITDNQIFYCPYGVDLSQFKPKTYRQYHHNTHIDFVFLGDVKQLKGIYYLFEAFMNIPKEKASLTVIGGYSYEKDFEKYTGHISFTGRVNHNDLPTLLKNYDVFIFPSLGEGMGMAAIEAAAVGLPLIISENVGLSDKLINGKEGFIVKIQSVDDLIKYINWYIEHSKQIPKMGRSARKMAEEYSWDHYYKRINDFITGSVSN